MRNMNIYSKKRESFNNYFHILAINFSINRPSKGYEKEQIL